MQKFRPFSRPFRPTVEKNYLVNFGAKSSQLFKNVQDLKIGRILANGPRYKSVSGKTRLIIFLGTELVTG